MPLQNDLLLRAARGEYVERTPVWLMRQAGRILKEYREVRAKAGSFINLVTNPELAAEVTIQPVDILGVDAAIIFSDILVIPEAMGLPYEMVESKGPNFPKVVRSMADVDALGIAQASDLQYVMDALKITKDKLQNRVPLIGFAGAPFTLLAYMIEGSGSKTFSKAKAYLYQEPELCHALLEKITASTINYLKGQIAAGADLVQIFDSWAGILSPTQYSEFSLKYIQAICTAITEVPVTVFAKGAYFALPEMNDLSCQTIGLDWNMNAADARLTMPSKTLQGNLDPCALFASHDNIIAETKNMIDAFGTQNYIANLGHGLYPDINPENVKTFINTVKTYSEQKASLVLS